RRFGKPENMPVRRRRFAPDLLKPLRPVAVFRAFYGGFNEEVRGERQHHFRFESQAPADFVKENVAAARETGKAFDARFVQAASVMQNAALDFRPRCIRELRRKPWRKTAMKVNHMPREGECEGFAGHGVKRSLSTRRFSREGSISAIVLLLAATTWKGIFIESLFYYLLAVTAENGQTVRTRGSWHRCGLRRRCRHRGPV